MFAVIIEYLASQKVKFFVKLYVFSKMRNNIWTSQI